MQRKQKYKHQIPPLPGFPWKGKFRSLEEINEYMDADALVCLLCGRSYQKLATHIVVGHRIAADKYRKRFGINWTRSLAGCKCREESAKRCRKRRKEGTLLRRPLKSVTKAALLAKKRPFNEAVRNSSRKRALASHGLTRSWDEKDIEEYLRRIKTGRTPSEVGQDLDMPGFAYFSTHLGKNPAFKKKFEKIWDNLPFSVQARGQYLGERFEKSLLKLRRQGKIWKEIGRILGVKPGTACGHWGRMKRKGKLAPGDYTDLVRWKAKDHEEFLRRIKSGRTPREVSGDDDMPSLPCFQRYRKENLVYKKRFDRIWADLPFRVQARGFGLGDRFKRAIVSLQRQGFTWEEIGRKLDVNHHTAHTVWDRLRSRGKLRDYV